MASTNKLYPPIINGVLPAFYRTTHKTGEDISWSIKITIPFAMNQMVSINSVKTMFLRLKTVQTNEVKYCGYTNNIDTENGVVHFTLTSAESADLIEGLFYKAQIAYCDISSSEKPDVTEAGYFSTVGIIKCIAKPSVAIADFDEKQINVYNNRYLGVYTLNIEYGDSNEKVYSYCFTITDKNNNIYLTSGTLLHNSNNDINHWESQDEFYVNKLLVSGEIYYLQYTVTTVNGLELSSPTYRLMAGESVDMEKKIDILPELNYDEGYIQINFRGPRRYIIDEEQQVLITKSEDYCTGLFLLSRGYLKDDYMVWEDIARFNLSNERPSTHIERDFTIELGITYKYRLQQYNLKGVYSNPIYSKEIYADFEDMFLYDGVRQLKVRFNPKVSSFKVDIPEQKLETIGSKYPYIFRNGNVYYHEFPISGLISYLLDEAKLFLAEPEVIEGNILEKNLFYLYPYLDTNNNIKYFTDENGNAVPASLIEKYNSAREVGSSFNYNINSDVRIDKDLTSENLMSERYFKLAVLKWLTNGEIKLFRSPGEGNYLVRLLNTSMTPNDTLGRMLHTFNTTAYEIADLNYDNLLKYKLINMAAPDLGLILFSTKEFTSIGTKEVLYRSSGDELLNFEVNDCMPGDLLIITFVDGTTETITIGVTGSFSMTLNDKPIEMIEFIGLPGAFAYPRSITLSYIDNLTSYFDQLSSVITTTIVGRTYCGPKIDLVNFKTVDNATGLNYHKFNILIGNITPAYKTKLLNMEMLKVRAREIIPLYEVAENQYATTPFGVGYPLNELLNIRISDLEIINGFALFKIYKPITTVIDISHSLTPEEIVSDKQYNEMYPDWIFKTYYNPLADETSKFFTDAPDMRFAINYDLNGTELSYVNLTELRELTLYNLGPIECLWLGNGVLAETVMRILVINYAIEDTDIQVSSAKIAYLNAKNSMFNDYETFMINHANDALQYNDYLIAKAQAELAALDLETLNKSYTVLLSLTTDISSFKDDLKNNVTTAITSINTYKDNVYAYILNTTVIPPLAIPIPELPDDITIDGYKARIDAAVLSDPQENEELLDDIIVSILDELNTKFNSIANIYLNWFNLYDRNIPNTEDITDLLPEGWSLELWRETSKADIITVIANNVLTILSRMYDIMHYYNIIIKPFTDDYLSNTSRLDLLGNNPWLTKLWTDSMAQEVLNEQEQVGGLHEVTYDDIVIPEAEEDEPISIYHPSSLILIKQQEYQTVVNELETLEMALIQAKTNAAEAEEARQEAYQVIQEYLDIIAQCDTDDIQLQNTIAIAELLIAGLELEEATEGNLAAIKYLQALIRNALTVIANNIDIRSQANAAIYAFEHGEETTRYDYPTLLADANRTRQIADTALSNYDAKVRVKDTLYNEIEALISEWNNDLSRLDTYLKVLKTIDILKPLIDDADTNLQALIELIQGYRVTYNELILKHATEYNRANNAIYEITSLQLAFNKLNDLIIEWDQRLKDLREKAELPAVVPEPVIFDWTTLINNLKSLWNNYIMLLINAYRAVEKRYV